MEEHIRAELARVTRERDDFLTAANAQIATMGLWIKSLEGLLSAEPQKDTEEVQNDA